MLFNNYFKQVSIYVGVFQIFNACNNSSISDEKTVSFHGSHVDSIWRFTQSLETTDKRAEFTINKFEELNAQSSTIDSADKLLELMAQESKKTNDPIYQCYYYTLMKSISLRKGDIETAEQWSAQRKPIRKYATEKGNLSDILFESILYYRKGYLDSGIYELTKGVALSEKLNDTFFRPIYLINLGSYYFSAGLFGSAVKHFTDGLNFKYHHLDNTALNISNIDEYLLIHNNLMACYIEEKEFSKVYDTYNSVKSRIKPGMGSDYTMQLLELNYLSALVLDKKLTLAEEQFQHIQVDSLLDVHQTFYQGIRGDFLVKSANNQAYRSYYQEIESELYEDPQTFLRYHADNLLYGVQNRLIDLNYQKLSSYYDSLEIGQFNYFAAILLARLLKELADYNGLHTASIRFEKAFLQHELDFQKQHDEIRLSKVNFELEKLQFQKALQKRKYEIDAINEQNKSILIISVVVIGFLVMTILWLYQKHISRRKILSIISLEKN